MVWVISFILAACTSLSVGGTGTPAKKESPSSEAHPSPTAEQAETAEGEVQDIQVTPATPFHLAVGQSAAIGELVITFIEITEDSRCPEGARCVWAGQVKALVRVEKGGVLVGEYELTHGVLREGDMGEVEIDGLVLKLLDVQPYPQMDEHIGADEYVVEMVVE